MKNVLVVLVGWGLDYGVMIRLIWIVFDVVLLLFIIVFVDLIVWWVDIVVV